MKKVCPTCGGTGEVGFFQGVSRFLLSWDECPQCSGTGYIGEEAGPATRMREEGQGKRTPKKKKK